VTDRSRVPRAPGGGRAPVGLGFGWRGQRRGSGGLWWIRRPPERGGRQGSRRWRGGPAGCAFWELGTVGRGVFGAGSLMWQKLKNAARDRLTATTRYSTSWMHRSNKTRGNLSSYDKKLLDQLLLSKPNTSTERP
jgi:hypothetical protein